MAAGNYRAFSEEVPQSSAGPSTRKHAVPFMYSRDSFQRQSGGPTITCTLDPTPLLLQAPRPILTGGRPVSPPRPSYTPRGRCCGCEQSVCELQSFIPSPSCCFCLGSSTPGSTPHPAPGQESAFHQRLVRKTPPDKTWTVDATLSSLGLFLAGIRAPYSQRFKSD